MLPFYYLPSAAHAPVVGYHRPDIGSSAGRTSSDPVSDLMGWDAPSTLSERAT